QGVFYPFQQAIKYYTGISYEKFYNNAFNFYKKEWHVDTTKKTELYLTKPSNGFVTNYLFPYQIGNDSLLYLKSGYRQVPTFIIKDRHGEHRLRVKDISADVQYSYRNGKIVYAAYERDARWAWRDYSVIKLVNIKSWLQKTITHQSKYFTPDISEDGSKIVAVQNAADGKSEIHILDAATGGVIKRIKSPGVNVFTDPKFIDGNELVSAVRLTDGKMSLAHIDLNTGKMEWLTPASFNVAGYPCVAGGMIYFTASYAGNDDVFALRLKDRKIFQVTNDRLGNYYINVRARKGIVSHFTADGYQLKEIDMSSVSLKEINTTAWQETPGSYRSVTGDIQNTVSLDKTPDRNFPERGYDIGTNLFNFHSWRPYYEDPDFTFSLYGENILNSFQSELFYHYNQDEKTNGLGFNTVYGALFPYLNFGTEYTFNRSDTTGGKTVAWSQLDTKIGLSIPLNFSQGQTYKLLTVGSNFGLRNQFIKSAVRADFNNVNFSYLHHFINWQQTIQSARQHIFPRLGYTFSINHRYAVGNYTGYQFIGKTSVYLPGFYSTHSIVLTGSFQQRDTAAALFSNAFAISRGYDPYYLSRMWRLSANYHFPVVYPDWGFGNVFYLQRIRGNVFYDFTKIYSKDKSVTGKLRSIGTEIYFDTRWWNQYPLTFGIRFSHLLDADAVGAIQSNVVQIILPTSIIPR
ncbi:MAG: hypothetical protein JWM28_536, partial [Chitinophagaceae bacterium]|nr:hypothetical protein [Chitinophagaceae bacterium]